MSENASAKRPDLVEKSLDTVVSTAVSPAPAVSPSNPTPESEDFDA
jgi:hypothetical protein